MMTVRNDLMDAIKMDLNKLKEEVVVEKHLLGVAGSAFLSAFFRLLARSRNQKVAVWGKTHYIKFLHSFEHHKFYLEKVKYDDVDIFMK